MSPSTISIIVIVVLAVLAIFMMIRGYQKGFAKMVIPTASLIVGVLGAIVLSQSAYKLVDEKTDWTEQLSLKLETFLEEKGALDGNIQDLVNNTDLPEKLQEVLMKALSGLQIDPTEMVKEAADRVADFVIKVGTFIAVALICFIIALIVGALLANMIKGPAMEKVDKILGLVLGLVMTLHLIELLGIVIMLFAATPAGEAIVSVIRESKVLSYLYDHNLLLDILHSFLAQYV